MCKMTEKRRVTVLAHGDPKKAGAKGSLPYLPLYHSSNIHNCQGPVALQVWKRDKWCTVAKIVPLDGQMVLAVAVRHQRGTDTTVSIPLLVLDHAEAYGCRWFYWRHDRRYEMRRMRLDTLRAEGWLQADGEVYIPLERMERVPWAKWPYAEQVVRLAPAETKEQERESQPAQLGLWGGRQ